MKTPTVAHPIPSLIYEKSPLRSSSRHVRRVSREHEHREPRIRSVVSMLPGLHLPRCPCASYAGIGRARVPAHLRVGVYAMQLHGSVRGGLPVRRPARGGGSRFRIVINPDSRTSTSPRSLPTRSTEAVVDRLP